ncbi:MAG: hypothetical protein VX904_01815 [Planctomycetota bacterium]|nr:hypothetical protein [Planctomycetota bacterium]
MSWFFMCVLLIGDGVAERSVDRTMMIEAGKRPYSQMDRDFRAFVLRETRAQSEAERAAAIEDLCDLYEELKQDPRLATSAVLQGYKAKFYSRLQRVKRELEAKLKREQRASVKATGNGVGDGAFPSTGLPQDQATLDVEVSGCFSGQFPLLFAANGGPTPLFWYAGGSRAGGANGDYGDDLVQLIQRTVKPDFWDVNGGPGSIYFYRPLNALVIRATSEVHRDLGGALDGLRKAGGR